MAAVQVMCYTGGGGDLLRSYAACSHLIMQAARAGTVVEETLSSAVYSAFLFSHVKSENPTPLLKWWRFSSQQPCGTCAPPVLQQPAPPGEGPLLP